MCSIKDMDIFVLQRFVSNINCKLSTVTDYYARHQILCVVTETNDLLLHFTNIKRYDNLKLVTWFKKSSKNIVDICFDPTGRWLLVLCFDNTIHIVPTFKILGGLYDDVNNIFSGNFITSYEIPIVGSSQYHRISVMRREPLKINKNIQLNSQSRVNSLETDFGMVSTDDILITPSCIAWWNAGNNRNRAVIGYSDGTVLFFGLDSNSCFRTTTGYSCVEKLFIYKDNGEKNILLVTVQNKAQYRVILDQCYIEKTFDSVMLKNTSQSTVDNKDIKHNNSLKDQSIIDKSKGGFHPAQIGLSIVKNISHMENNDANITKNNLRHSTKSRLSSLMLGSKKFNTFQFKTEVQKDNEYEDTSVNDFEEIDLVLKSDLINSENAYIYVAQHIRNISFLSVLDRESNTLSVHQMDLNLLPLFRYKVPDESKEILITSNILYSVQDAKNTDSDLSTTITILSSALASFKDNSDTFDYERAVLSSFKFNNENIINIHRKSNFFYMEPESCDSEQKFLRRIEEYYFYGNTQKRKEYSSNEEFLKIIFDPCYVVTNRNIYYIDMRKNPLEWIIDAALLGLWKQCEKFCNTFNIPFLRCMEFVGDHFLKNNKVNHALLSYNAVKIPPVRTALKLAINRENYPLMHLCSMALKYVYLTKSKYLNYPILKTFVENIQNLHAEDVIQILPKRRRQNEIIIEREYCSDHRYCSSDSAFPLQMTLSSQFHLSNLLLITLAEKAVQEKNYIPLWNFLVSNGKYHTHMTSIVLAQSGLHSSALVLAMSRGCFVEVFIALTNVVNQEFGVYSEINVCLYHLSEPLFLECIFYLQSVSEQYCNAIQKKLAVIKMSILKRLQKQFFPFAQIYRSMFDKYYIEISEQNACTEKSFNFISFFSTLIETYLAIIIHIQRKTSEENNIMNAFKTFNIDYENPKLQSTSNNFSPLSVGYAHGSCVIDGVAYFWGSNGVSSVFNIENLQDTNEAFYTVKSLDLLKELNLEVYAVKCGRQHTIILTNNGVFTFGSNQLYQLGIGRTVLTAQHPVHVEYLEYKYISLFDAGQYHNAVVADNKLYTWGWGLYGQLGHGDTENVEVPKVVTFFNDKKMINISLGHAHSLVLCTNTTYTELYVFGSNHFGQLGIGVSAQDIQLNNKILTPVLLNIGGNITLIQTKFFSNLAVTDKNKLYTWGSSPQALRLENQNKKRANTKQKIAATISKEIRRRTEVAADQCYILDANISKLPLSPEQFKNSDFDSISHSNTTYEDNFKKKKNIFTENYSQSQSITQQSTSEQRNVCPPNMIHMNPRIVDTENIFGNISYVATGLFHFALISSNNLLYTWGRNFDHQLGNQDKEKKYVYAPAKVDCIDSALYVDCGSDFTIVMTTQNIVKGFGGNDHGQCGLDVQQSVYNNLNQDRLMCLPITKRVMRFETHSVEYPHDINLPSPKSNLLDKKIQYFKSLPKYSSNIVNIHSEVWDDYQISQDTSKLSYNSDKQEATNWGLPYTCSSDYIHYCLFIFHNFYNSEKIMNFAKYNLEYQIRILLLNLNFVEAFRSCLTSCITGQNAIRIFQYFTKNENIPIKIENFKIYIYGLLNHFAAQNFHMADCETLFMSDLDYYLVELYFVLYLNNGSPKLTCAFRRKCENIFKINYTHESSFDAIDLIFEKLSIKFKTIICRNILKKLH